MCERFDQRLSFAEPICYLETESNALVEIYEFLSITGIRRRSKYVNNVVHLLSALFSFEVIWNIGARAG